MQNPREVPEIPLKNLFLEKVSEIGLPADQINVDLELKDISLYWANKEPTLMLIIAFCCIFFLFIMAGVL